MMLSASALIASVHFTELDRRPFASYKPRSSDSAWNPASGSLREARQGTLLRAQGDLSSRLLLWIFWWELCSGVKTM